VRQAFIIRSRSRVTDAAGFQLKGTGWYVTDFRGGKRAFKTGHGAGQLKGTGWYVTDFRGGNAPAATGTRLPAPAPRRRRRQRADSRRDVRSGAHQRRRRGRAPDAAIRTMRIRCANISSPAC
jgi:predicted nucleic acid-binding Zn ribbon protein